MNSAPYLSIVATARNDDHGGNLLGRMQVFINGVLEQCRHHRLSAELIIVDWNPPADRPTLVEALSWKSQDSPCEVRLIEVPAEIHSRLKHSETLPLFQMIAKNVGIRRARGQFILATNVDLLFSDELIGFVASRSLQEECIYRVDRYDVRSDVPINAPLDEQLAYCQQNIIRVNRKDGTETLNEMGKEAVSVLDSRSSVLVLFRQVARAVLPLPVRNAVLCCLPEIVVLTLHRLGLLNISPDHGKIPHNSNSAYGGVDGGTSDDAKDDTNHQPPPIHTNACGDFTLMSRQDWFRLRAYPEFEMYSLHLDSVLCHAAYHSGIHEVVLEDPMRIYHIEHAGSWTPQTEHFLRCRLEALSVPQISHTRLLEIDKEMQSRSRPIVFNGENWGYANETFALYG